jgi:hypothetical protein
MAAKLCGQWRLRRRPTTIRSGCPDPTNSIALSDQRNGMIVLASYPVYRGTRRLFQLKA